MPTTYKWIGGTSTAFGTATNFTPNGNPTTGDTVVFDQDATADLIGSDQSAITLASLVVYEGFIKSIGTTATPLKIKATSVQIGLQVDAAAAAGGPNRVVLDLSTAVSTIVIYNTGTTTPDTGLENVRLINTNASSAIIVTGGIVGIGTNSISDTATIPTITISGGRVNIGAGVTWTTANIGGNANVNIFAGGAGTTLNITGSPTVYTWGNYAIDIAVMLGGTWNQNNRKASGASVGTLTRTAGNVNIAGDPRAVTWTLFNEGGGSLKMYSSTQLTITGTVESNGNSLNRTVSLT